MNMKTDRELLELAAKAAGIKHSGAKAGSGLWVGHANPFEGFIGKPRWNPLTDDGDALRLAVAIPGVDLKWMIAMAWQAEDEQSKREAFVRRTIVMQAAVMGEVLS